MFEFEDDVFTKYVERQKILGNYILDIVTDLLLYLSWYVRLPLDRGKLLLYSKDDKDIVVPIDITIPNYKRVIIESLMRLWSYENLSSIVSSNDMYKINAELTEKLNKDV